MEGADEIKANLSNVASEIGRVRDQARLEVDALEKIRGMLDTGYLDTLIRSIEALESRITELEDDTLHAQEDVGRYQRDLEAEQERLKKLWDAYKTQEDELDRVKRDYPLMEEKLFERERAIESLKREITRLEPLSKYKGDYDNLVKEHRAVTGEAQRLDRELEKANDSIKDLEEEVLQLREVESHAGKAQELQSALDDERERLAKLYKVYEDLDAEKKEVEAALSEWQSWFKRARPAMMSVCEAVDSAPA